jgi:peptidoglycan hydrolase-like protein with peptidoglycan-binding domain
MKHSLGAVVALALGVSLAASAQAQTPQGQMTGSPTISTAPSSAMPQNRAAAPGAMQQAKTGRAISHKEMTKLAQQTLKAEGFYNGKIDGNWGSKSRQALIQFEKRHNLPASGTLNRNTFAALMGTTTPAVGSSVPRAQGAGSTSSMGATPGMPAPTRAPSAGAGTAGAAGAIH